eukprot:Skav201202  [mRNA]  locus=scaffold633:602771:607601:+ [translate_table: standard]
MLAATNLCHSLCGEALPRFPVGGVLLGQLGELVLHSHSAARRLRTLPCLLQTLLVVVRVQETVHGVLGVGEERVLSPGFLRLLGTLGARHKAPKGVLLEGVKDKGAKSNHREDQGGQWHQHCRPLSVVAVLCLRILRQHRQGWQCSRGSHCWVEVNPRFGLWKLLWAGQEAPRDAAEECGRQQNQPPWSSHC